MRSSPKTLVTKPADANETWQQISWSTPVGVSATNRASIAAKLTEKPYRKAYVAQTIKQGLAFQIRANREARKLSQEQLGQLLTKPVKQSSICRFEDPSYGNLTLNTLLEIADAFDVALLVKLVSHSKLLTETCDKSPSALYAESFDDEKIKLNEAYIWIQEVEHATVNSGFHITPEISATNTPVPSTWLSLPNTPSVDAPALASYRIINRAEIE